MHLQISLLRRCAIPVQSFHSFRNTYTGPEDIVLRKYNFYNCGCVEIEKEALGNTRNSQYIAKKREDSMNSLYFLFPTLLAILISFLFVRGASIALMMTGLEKHKARFQALSAFSGTGFTTKESEVIVNHPGRRKIIRYLMIMGNAGIVTVIVAGTSSFTTSSGYQIPINVVVLLVGIFLIYKLAKGRGLIRRWENYIENRLIKSAQFEETSTEDLLHFMEGYGLVKKIVPEGSALIGQSLAQLKLNKMGILVLGLEREKRWIPTPKAGEILKSFDRVVVYGPLDALKSKLVG
jgi:hypothetical protein